MTFRSNSRGTLILKQKFEGVGEIRRASGTHSPEELGHIADQLRALYLRGDFQTLCDVRDGRVRPLDLLANPHRGPRRRVAPPQLVYFIRSMPSGNIKIGVARDITTRLPILQCGTWERLEVILTLPGGVDLERRLHRRFAADHIAREWFTAGPEILAFIEREGATHPGSAHPGAPTPSPEGA